MSAYEEVEWSSVLPLIEANDAVVLGRVQGLAESGRKGWMPAPCIP
jgi:hypothetical protein